MLNRELIAELRQHSPEIPVVIMSTLLYDKNIRVNFNGEIGVTLSSKPLNDMIDDLIAASLALLSIDIAEQEIIPKQYWDAAKSLQNALEGFGVEVG